MTPAQEIEFKSAQRALRAAEKARAFANHTRDLVARMAAEGDARATDSVVARRAVAAATAEIAVEKARAHMLSFIKP